MSEYWNRNYKMIVLPVKNVFGVQNIRRQDISNKNYQTTLTKDSFEYQNKSISFGQDFDDEFIEEELLGKDLIEGDFPNIEEELPGESLTKSKSPCTKKESAIIDSKNYDAESLAKNPDIDIAHIHLRKIGHIPLLSDKKVKELSKIIQDTKGKKESEEKFINARNELIDGNYKLVALFANEYNGRGASYGDLINSGNEGLIKAAEKYDASKGYKFSTYASWWIKSKMQLEILKHSNTIKNSKYMEKKINAYNNAIEKLRAKSEIYYTPSDEEVAKELKKTVKYVKNIKQLMGIEIVSLNASINDSDSKTKSLIESIPDNKNKSLEKQAENVLLTEGINELISCLPEKAQIVLIKRFGLNGETPSTLDEIGEMLNVTRERVRQIEAKAIHTLRKNKKTLDFENFVRKV